jgi:hypothetical protein
VLLLLRAGDDRNDVLVAGPLATCVTRPYETPNGSSARLVMLRLACGSAIGRTVGSSDAATQLAFMVAARRIEELPEDGDTDDPVKVVEHELALHRQLAMRPIQWKEGIVDPFATPGEESAS